MKRMTSISIKVIIILLQIFILYVFTFIGNTIHNLFHPIIPGSIIGLLLLFICLCLKIIPLTFIEHGAGFLLGILSLFYIPATVGVMNYPSLLSLHGVLLAVVVLVSTVISMAIAGKTSQLFEKKKIAKEE